MAYKKKVYKKLPAFEIAYPEDLKTALTGGNGGKISVNCQSGRKSVYDFFIQNLKNSNLVLDYQNYVQWLHNILFIEEWSEKTEISNYFKDDIEIQVFKNGKYKFRFENPIDDYLLKKIGFDLTTRAENGNSWDLKIEEANQNFIVAFGTPEFDDFYNKHRPKKVHLLVRHDRYPFRCAHYALSLVEHQYKIFRYRILPLLYSFKDIVREREFQMSSIIFENKKIIENEEQQRAILNILNKTSHPAPFILFGPPGTGKTDTIVEAIYQVWKNEISSKILVCTPSNTAADVLAVRLLKYNVKDDLYRYYSYRIKNNKDLIPGVLAGSSNFKESSSLSRFERISKISKKRIVICTLCHSTKLILDGIDHFTHLFIDEASQESDPNTIIPFSLLQNFEDPMASGHIILSGDPKQLGPVVVSDLAKKLLGKSFLERIMDQDIYQKQRLSKRYNENYIVKLLKSYRCHQSIIRISNELFYEGELNYLPKDIKQISGLLLNNEDFRIVFNDVLDGSEKKGEHYSVSNRREQQITKEYVNRLLRPGSGLNSKNIGIVTPFALQSSEIKKMLKNEKIEDVDVGTVELFQGQEKDVIIFSSVRTKIFRHINRLHIGSLSNEKKFNVAITRAKSLLIIIGNSEALKIDVNWRTLIEACERNNSYYKEYMIFNQYANKMESPISSSSWYNSNSYHSSNFINNVKQPESYSYRFSYGSEVCSNRENLIKKSPVILTTAAASRKNIDMLISKNSSNSLSNYHTKSDCNENPDYQSNFSKKDTRHQTTSDYYLKSSKTISVNSKIISKSAFDSRFNNAESSLKINRLSFDEPPLARVPSTQKRTSFKKKISRFFKNVKSFFTS